MGVDVASAADAWFERDAGPTARIKVSDDEMDDLHTALTAELAWGGTPLPVAMDMALVARFYERLGDHAVNVAYRVRFLAGIEADPLRSRGIFPAHLLARITWEGGPGPGGCPQMELGLEVDDSHPPSPSWR